MKTLLKQICPPFLWQLARIVYRTFVPYQEPELTLFDGSDALFLEHIKGVSVYAEYGVGVSTVWVSDNTDAEILSVESSAEWVQKIESSVNTSRWQKRVVDLGQLGDWGRPVSFENRANFADYPQSLWDMGKTPELVLVDGRFRVACFLTSMLNAPAGTKILFDDYADRPHFHLVEEFFTVVARNDRQALFIVPDEFDRDAVTTLRDDFKFVLE